MQKIRLRRKEYELSGGKNRLKTGRHPPRVKPAILQNTRALMDSLGGECHRPFIISMTRMSSSRLSVWTRSSLRRCSGRSRKNQAETGRFCLTVLSFPASFQVVYRLLRLRLVEVIFAEQDRAIHVRQGSLAEIELFFQPRHAA